MSASRIVLPALLALSLPAAAAHASAETVPGRVSWLQGQVLVLPAGAEDWGYIESNVAVLPGDSYWTAEDGLLELELPRGVVLRAAGSTRFDVSSFDRVPVLRHREGSLFVCTGDGARLAVRVETPAATVRVEGWSAVRLDSEREGLTRITVRRGRADVEAMGEVAHLGEDRRLYVEPGLLPSSAVHADPAIRDAFEDWAVERCGEAREGMALDLVGWGELGRYGSWTSWQEFNVWVPVVPAIWAPYRTGRWWWYAGYGWTWVPFEPWGWVTHHYGSWMYIAGIGWAWVPGMRWSGGHVAWWHAGGHVIWSPLDPWGYPAAMPGAGGTVRLGGHRVWAAGASIAPVDGLGRGVLDPSPLPPREPPGRVVQVKDPALIAAPPGRLTRVRDPLQADAGEVAERLRRGPSRAAELPPLRPVEPGSAPEPAAARERSFGPRAGEMRAGPSRATPEGIRVHGTEPSAPGGAGSAPARFDSTERPRTVVLPEAGWPERQEPGTENAAPPEGEGKERQQPGRTRSGFGTAPARPRVTLYPAPQPEPAPTPPAVVAPPVPATPPAAPKVAPPATPKPEPDKSSGAPRSGRKR